MAISPKAVANFFLDAAHEGGDTSLTPMKIQKLVYYAHGWHLGLLGLPLVNEPVEAWPYGPVIPSLYHEFKHYRNGQVTSKATEFVWPSSDQGQPSLADLDQVAPEIPNDEQLLVFLTRIWDVHKGLTPIQLSNATHATGSPWDQVKQLWNGKIPKGTQIPDDSIREYFKQLAAAK